MKTILPFFFCLSPLLGQACSCAWLSNFCETTNSNSVISAVKVIEKVDGATVDFGFNHFIKVVLIENLRGNAPTDTLTILAAQGTSCDPSPELFQIGDQMIVHITEKQDDIAPEPYDFQFSNGCSAPFLFVKNGRVHPRKDKISEGATYENFKSKIEDCAKASILDNPELLKRLTRIFPNPASEKLSISINLATSFSYVLFNSAGQKIAEENVMARWKELDISSLHRGVYFLKIQVNEGSFIKKVVKI